MEAGGQTAPVSILKKPRVTEAVNAAVRKSVMIAEGGEAAEARSEDGDRDSDDSALGLKTPDTDSDALQSLEADLYAMFDQGELTDSNYCGYSEKLPL